MAMSKECRLAAMEHLGRIVSSSFCTSLVVFVAFVLTVIAVAYKPPDLQLEPPKKIATMFNVVRNATFERDDTVLITGEDVSGGDYGSIALNSTIPTFFNESVRGSCDPGSRIINCSDPGVFAAIEEANKKKFPNMMLFDYSSPVKGSDDNQCDVGWKFLTRRQGSNRTYSDYRRYTLLVNSSCDYVVERIGKWHSGKSVAWRPENFNDSVDTAIWSRPMNTFWEKKYLHYSRGGDFCKGMSQYMWSFLCALGEAQYLNRSLVVDLELCLSGSNNPGHGDEKGKDFRLYFDYEHLREGASVVSQQVFLRRWSNWNKKHPQRQIDVRVVDDFRVSPTQLREEMSTVLWRRFDRPEPDNYWYRVCEGETEKVVQRPWHLLWKSKRLMNIVNSICGRMEWDFDALHVVRGKKAEDRERWPNLDRDTRPEALLEKLDKVLPEGRKLYIASNEMVEGYFDKLRTKYNVRLLNDFKDLWAAGSQWYNETAMLTKKKDVEFDGYMRAEVDAEVVMRARKRIETFGELTSDCKEGINTC